MAITNTSFNVKKSIHQLNSKKMSSIHIKSTLTFLFLFSALFLRANVYHDITVAKDGSGNVKTITQALNAIPSDNFQRFVIFIKNGVYNEKIRIEKDYVTLIGESRDSTIIQYNQLKKDWVAHKDYKGAAVVNIYANDAIINNITLKNTMPKVGPTAYVIYGTGTRTIMQNCNILNNGANTVTLVNDNTGMYYFNNCYIEGTVDFMKAMGWCYMNNCHFFQKEAIASIWHAGINHPKQKMVIKNSSFDGVEHFFIGRHHYDAQFFIVDCQFSNKLADKPIYRKRYPKNPSKEKPYIFGDRHYYYNCKKEGTNYAWLSDNLANYDKKLKSTQITSEWTFDEKWKPESKERPVITSSKIINKTIYLTFNQPVTVRNSVVFKTKTGKLLQFKKGKGRYILSFVCDQIINKNDIKAGYQIIAGQIINTQAHCVEQPFNSTL